jgi:hypothetical protein
VRHQRRLKRRLLAQVEDDEKADFHQSIQQSAFSFQPDKESRVHKRPASSAAGFG